MGRGSQSLIGSWPIFSPAPPPSSFVMPLRGQGSLKTAYVEAFGIIGHSSSGGRESLMPPQMKPGQKN